jgi:hypothetical protein
LHAAQHAECTEGWVCPGFCMGRPVVSQRLC